MPGVTSEFTLGLFEELSRLGIPWVIARRVELLPEPPPGDDVDAVVPRAALPRLDRPVRELAAQHGGFCFGIERSAGHVHFWLCLPEPTRGLAVLHLDFQDAIRERGLVLVPGADLLADPRPAGEWRRPAPAAEAVALLLHDLVGKGRLPAGDLAAIRELSAEDPQGFAALLGARLGRDPARVLEAALAAGDAETLLARRGDVRRALAARQPGARTRFQLARALRNLGFALRRRGALAVLVGPDGSGKTTLVEEVRKVLEGAARPAERLYFGQTEPLLPTKRLMKALHRSRGGGGGEKRDDRMPARPGARQAWTYWLGTVHTLLDQALRYALQARPRLARARILLCDRYFYDALVSPGPGPAKALLDRALLWLSPRPDLVYVLHDDAAAIHARKAELAVDEIERQQACYARLLAPPVGARQLQIEPDPGPNARRIAREVLRAYGRRHGAHD